MDGAKPPLPRTTSFNSSPLVRLLTALDIADVAPSKQTVAERWSPWLDWTDAIALSAVLNAEPAARPAAVPPAPPALAAGGRAVIDEARRVHHDLSRAITTDAVFAAGAPADDGDTAAPWRHRCLAHQRAMEAHIGPLRARVRAALARHSPRLGQLAALDAVLDEALAARERHLLSTLPVRLAQRPERLRGDQVRDVLLAELETRWQPVQGLIDALAEPADLATRQA
jgi:hypothetical protein